MNEEKVYELKIEGTEPTKKKVKLEKPLLVTIIVVLVVLVALGAALGGIFGTAVSAAKGADDIRGMEIAEERAIDAAYRFLTENGYYNGAKSGLIVADRDKDLKTGKPLKESFYLYDFEIKAGYIEIDIEYNSKTRSCRITDLDRD